MEMKAYVNICCWNCKQNIGVSFSAILSGGETVQNCGKENMLNVIELEIVLR
jgi:hypothetical protein